jgi:membrane protease YdiL (CAAX protease family)
VYLLYISIVEEIAFRLFLPAVIEPAAGFLSAIVLSNFLFALLHYFTLRWKWKNCVFVFLGGVGLSRLLENSGDLALLILVHFVATFLNTPSPPDTSTIAKGQE